jgi:hypothetical protein
MHHSIEQLTKQNKKKALPNKRTRNQSEYVTDGSALSGKKNLKTTRGSKLNKLQSIDQTQTFDTNTLVPSLSQTMTAATGTLN